jgi:SAM-dependent methyltransferase
MPPAEVELEVVPCALCAGTRFVSVYRHCVDRLHGVPGDFDVVACPGCGLVQTSPRPTPAGIAAYYPDAYGPFHAPRSSGSTGLRALMAPAGRLWMRAGELPYRLRYRPGRRPARPHRGAGRLLEVGTGAGAELARLVGAGWDAWGIEPDPAAAAAAAASSGLAADRVSVGGIQDADHPPRSFDRIRMVHVIEHLHDPRDGLLRARRWLRPGGTLVIRCPNFASVERRAFGRHWLGLDVPRHLYHFTGRTLGRLLHEAGFATVRAIPEPANLTLSPSVGLWLAARRGRALPSPSVARDVALAPLSALQRACGGAPSLEILARPS